MRVRMNPALAAFDVTPADEYGHMPAATTDRRAHAVPVHPAAKRHRRQVLRWALANAQPVDRDALAALVAVLTDPVTGKVADRWQSDQVPYLVMSIVPAWCRSHRAAPPSDITTSLATYLRYLAANDGLAPGSDSATELRRAVADQGLDRRRSRARHPARQLAPVLPIC